MAQLSNAAVYASMLVYAFGTVRVRRFAGRPAGAVGVRTVLVGSAGAQDVEAPVADEAVARSGNIALAPSGWPQGC